MQLTVIGSSGNNWRYVTGWQRSIWVLIAAWGILLALFWRDAADMIGIWWNSSTFNHILLIVPSLAWLVHQRKAQLAALQPVAWAPASLYIAAGAITWVIGDAGGLAVARQLGLIIMLQGSVALLLGPNVTHGLLFPLFYLFFILPVGEEAVPFLQTLTAKMCMTLLAWFSVPAILDGIFINTQAGYFRVAEACSGVKFLIAMVAYGVLVANLCFKSWQRRAVFVAACVAVPIMANGVRAFVTIYVAQSHGIAFAESFDHVVFGWVFFGIVIALIMAASWPFFDKRPDAVAFDPALLQGMPRNVFSRTQAIGALLVITLIPVAWSAFVSARISPVPDRIDLPAVAGWEVVPYAPKVHWTPRFDGASHYLAGRYRNATGQEADLFVAVYDKQTEGRELIGFGQGAVDPADFWSWSANLPAPPNGKAERIKTKGATRDVLSFYRINGTTTGSAGRVKFATMQARLFNGNQQAVVIIVSAEETRGISARPSTDAFVAALGNIDKVADRFAGLR